MEAKRAAGDGMEPALGAPAPGSPGDTMAEPARAAEPQPAQAAEPQPAQAALPQPAPVDTAKAGRRGASPLAVVALVLLAATLGVGGFLAWQVYGTTWLARSAAAESVAQLRAEWATATPAPTDDGQAPAEVVPAPGEPAWILRIPSQGVVWPVVSGVDEDLLTEAVGWYPSTALPGQVGNVALAGLRLTHGAPFAGLLDLAEGDEVIIETALATYTYRITLPPSQLTVHRDDTWVLDPVPGKPDLAPTEAILTLTTHEDLIETPDRSVGFGILENTEIP
ncbi:sortase domain-containing protein [Tessaracoccus sp. G1721]